MPFTSETARLAGKKSKRGKAKISMSTRRFLYEMLNENKEKFRYMLDELGPRDFINTWLKLLPYIISMSHLQKFDVSELSRKETQEIVNDITRWILEIKKWACKEPTHLKNTKTN